MAGSTDAKGLEEMTESMLLGEEGLQKDELEKMVDWMAEHCYPDIIHLSNALLLGLAHRIKEKMDVPVVCSLQDEDVWVDVMKPEHRHRVWKLMQEKSADVDAFIAVSQYFRLFMMEKLAIPAEKIFPVYLGVDPLEYEYINATQKKRNLGFISRMCYDNGLDIAVDAFIILRQTAGFEDVNFIITGGHTAVDHKYIARLKRQLRKAGLESSVIFEEKFEEKERRDFFRKVALATVPVRNGEAFGMYLMELMASGIPIVQPDLGAFPEIVALSGGGITYSPNMPDVLADTWRQILTDKDRISQLSSRARAGIEQHFNIHLHAREMVSVYEQVISKQNKNVVDAE
jgi:glycosyltransferase involved in cell wall biosynthesis